MTWRIYAVTVQGFPPALFSARSRGHAMSKALRGYQNYDDRCTFARFLMIATAGLFTGTLADDGYGSVRQQYGVDPKIGARVRLQGEGRLTGSLGIVIYPGGPTSHVHVVLDGASDHVIVHPHNVEILAREDHAA